MLRKQGVQCNECVGTTSPPTVLIGVAVRQGMLFLTTDRTSCRWHEHRALSHSLAPGGGAAFPARSGAPGDHVAARTRAARGTAGCHAAPTPDIPLGVQLGHALYIGHGLGGLIALVAPAVITCGQ